MVGHRASAGGGRLRPAPARLALVLLAALVTTAATVTPAQAAAPRATATAVNPALLPTGHRINPGTSLVSPNGFVRLLMLRDGNMVVTAGGHVSWASNTRGVGNYAVVDAAGDFAVRTGAGRKIWATHTDGPANVVLLTDDGNVALRTRTGRLLWSSRSRTGELDDGYTLRAGQFLTGTGGDRLLQQSDGNLVLRRANGTVAFNTRTSGRPGASTVLQADGNLVTYSRVHLALWHSGAAGSGARLVLGADGVLALHRANGSVAWTSRIAPPAAVPQTAAGYAGALLKMWGGKVTGLPGARSDLLATSRNQSITNSDSCGRTVRVDLRLVRFLYTVTSRYKIKINNIITGHGCDSGRHPNGRATDLGGAWSLATGAATSFGGFWGPNNATLDREFAGYASTILPIGSGLGQRYCPGVSAARIAAGIMFFADSCNHQHVQV